MDRKPHPKPKSEGQDDQPNEKRYQQVLRSLNLSVDYTTVKKVQINNVAIVTSDTKTKARAKKLIEDELKRPYRSITLKLQWSWENNSHKVDEKLLNDSVQLIEMVGAADVVESAISIYLRFCSLHTSGADQITDALKKVSHLTSLSLFDSTEDFALAVAEKIAEANINLKTFRIRKNEKELLSRPAKLSKAISKLISQKPNLEKLDLQGLGKNCDWPMIISSIINSRIRYLDISKNNFPINAFISLFAQAKNLKVLNAAQCNIQSDDRNATIKFFQELTGNTTIRSLNILQIFTVDMTFMPDVIRTNTTLQSLKFSLSGRGESTETLFKHILDALKDNKTLLSVTCEGAGRAKEKQDAATNSQTLHQFNGFTNKRNAKNYAKNNMAIQTFAILFAKNRHLFVDWLPFELWLKIASYLNSPGLMDVDKRLLETIQQYKQKNL